jgi:hypothetical protein
MATIINVDSFIPNRGINTNPTNRLPKIVPVVLEKYIFPVFFPMHSLSEEYIFHINGKAIPIKTAGNKEKTNGIANSYQRIKIGLNLNISPSPSNSGSRNKINAPQREISTSILTRVLKGLSKVSILLEIK